MTTDWLEIKLGAEMQAVLNRSAWYLLLSNVFVTSSDSIVVMSSMQMETYVTMTMIWERCKS